MHNETHATGAGIHEQSREGARDANVGVCVHGTCPCKEMHRTRTSVMWAPARTPSASTLNVQYNAWSMYCLYLEVAFSSTVCSVEWAVGFSAAATMRCLLLTRYLQWNERIW